MSAYIIATIFVLLISLVGYLFLSHTIEKRRVQRQRLITALRARRNAFRDLATSFPNGFLPAELTTLLYRSLLDICEQLSNLEPKDNTHLEQLNFYTGLLAAQKENADQPRVRLENPEQIKEARTLLQELYKFVIQQSAMKLINPVQADAYTDQIKRLALQITVDGHIINARQAQKTGKARLAIHHYTLARKLFASDNANRTFDKQIAQLDNTIEKLSEKIVPEDIPSEDPNKNSEPNPLATKEWENFTQNNEKWKKKQVYD